MWPIDQYQLLDFGNGRKLERFGQLILNREYPASEGTSQAKPALWPQAEWSSLSEQPAPTSEWTVSYQQIKFKLRITPFGHVGLFPEHEQHWQWLQTSPTPSTQANNLLNLFAYTGGATLVMAAAGWQVTHVDASAPTVAWARENCQLSQLESAPIRWLVEDARRYVARELKRGRSYTAILLDPPSYGHGPNGKAWDIQRDLPELVNDCCQLLSPGGRLMLTGHSPDAPLSPRELATLLRDAGHAGMKVESGRTVLHDTSGRTLDCGWYLRAELSPGGTGRALAQPVHGSKN